MDANPVSTLITGAVLAGVFVGIAVQRARHAFTQWRNAIRGLPVLKNKAYGEVRRAGTAVLIVSAVLYALIRAGG
ncbi:hypothetical protein [Actinomadura alba]|uniref:Uncharacterized protein n=1 Tax=Actinomadura alba TaxID=406431 RepID=A0ABR7LNW5_9ACTN|nr:hypothetical protein [Actinomadura alba]MBC6466259.1 hypothetical protein [Actinomadura alba]